MKPIISLSKWKTQVNCFEPNDETQIDFGGPIKSEEAQDILFLAWIDCFSKWSTVEVFDKTNESNFVKFLVNYIEIHRDPHNLD